MKFPTALKTRLQALDTKLDVLMSLLPSDTDFILMSDQAQYSASDIQSAELQVNRLRELVSLIGTVSFKTKDLIANIPT